MKHTALRKYLLLVSVSIFSCSTGAEAGKLDNLDWDSEKIVTKPARFIPSQGNKNSREFNGGARCFIEKIDFFDEDVQDLPLERGRFIANQDADHPDSLRSLSVWDTEKNLMYTKEEVLGKQGKKIIYCDHQADVSYWKKKGRWYVVAPYAFGYYKEQYTSRKALEERLEGLFQQRVINYPSKFYEVSLQEKDHFIIKKFEGWVFKKVLETKKASNIQEVHQFFLDRERKRYTDYLYEGEEAPSKLKSLGLATLLIGAGVVDGINVQKLMSSRIIRNQTAEPEDEMNLGELALMTTTAFVAPKLLPIYFFLKASGKLGVKGEKVFCKDGECSSFSNGPITSDGNFSVNGDISVQEQAIIFTKGNIRADRDLQLKAQDEIILNSSTVITAQKVFIEAPKIQLHGRIDADAIYVNACTKEGESGSVDADGGRMNAKSISINTDCDIALPKYSKNK